MKVMGMDLSWVGSALVTVEGTPKSPEITRKLLLDKGSSKRKYRLQGIENLEYVAGAIGTELGEVLPDLVVLEDYSGGGTPNPFTLALIGEVTGPAKLWMRHHGIRWIEVANSTLKKFVTGKGAGPKSVVLEGCYRKWKVGSDILGSNDNLIDAYCLARFGVAFLAAERGDVPTKLDHECFAKAREGGSPRPTKARGRRKAAPEDA